jgi:hypothetical protein
MNETTLQMVERGPDFADGIVEIRSPNGTKRITTERLAEITFESAKDQAHFDRLNRGGGGLSSKSGARTASAYNERFIAMKTIVSAQTPQLG